jgi:hypothetical protein
MELVSYIIYHSRHAAVDSSGTQSLCGGLNVTTLPLDCHMLETVGGTCHYFYDIKDKTPE